MAKIILVNEKDEIIGYKERKNRNPSDIIRCAGLWVFNDDKEVLIAQRSHEKDHDPGKWGPSAAGTLEEGETYVSNIIKEAREEIGLTLKESELFIGSHGLSRGTYRFFYQSFFVKMNVALDDFVVQKEEVAALQWIHIGRLSEWICEKPEEFTETFGFPEPFENTLAEFL